MRQDDPIAFSARFTVPLHSGAASRLKPGRGAVDNLASAARHAAKRGLEMQQRPTGVALLAVAAAVLGALAILAAGAWWNASEGLAWLPRVHGGERLVAVVLLATGLCEIVLAYGVWRLRPWAWTLGVLLEIIAIVLAVLQLGRLEPVRHIITIGVAAVTLWYLTTPRIRAAFGRS